MRHHIKAMVKVASVASPALQFEQIWRSLFPWTSSLCCKRRGVCLKCAANSFQGGKVIRIPS